jgi:hypothetical protein
MLSVDVELVPQAPPASKSSLAPHPQCEPICAFT